MKRIRRFVAVYFPDARAEQAVLTAQIVDTETGNVFAEKFEVNREDLRELLDSTLAVCSQFGQIAPETRPLADTHPEQAVEMPVDDMWLYQVKGDARRMMLRVGAVDLAVRSPDGKDGLDAPPDPWNGPH